MKQLLYNYIVSKGSNAACTAPNRLACIEVCIPQNHSYVFGVSSVLEPLVLFVAHGFGGHEARHRNHVICSLCLRSVQVYVCSLMACSNFVVTTHWYLRFGI